MVEGEKSIREGDAWKKKTKITAYSGCTFAVLAHWTYTYIYYRALERETFLDERERETPRKIPSLSHHMSAAKRMYDADNQEMNVFFSFHFMR